MHLLHAIAIRLARAAVLGAVALPASAQFWLDSFVDASDPQSTSTPAVAPAFKERYSWGRHFTGGITVNTETSPRVYVIDGGVGFHEDLNSVIVRVNPTLPLGSVSAVGCYGHGTHVAGIIAARRGNRGTAGVASGAKIISVSISTQNHPTVDCAIPYTETPASVLRAIAWVKEDITANGGGKTAIVNMSLAGEHYSQYSASGIAAAMRDLATPAPGYPGALVVQAAGNYGGAAHNGDACYFAYGPAHDDDGLLVVGGVRENGQIVTGVAYHNHGRAEPGWTNMGPCVEVYAPSYEIWSAFNPGSNGFLLTDPATFQRESQLGTHYSALQGTSVAAPHIAALAVGFLRENPNLTPALLEREIRSRAFYQGTVTLADSPFREDPTLDGLIDHYYLKILGRSSASDPAGAAFWNAEVMRFLNMGADAREVFRVLAKVFFFSQEYQLRNRTDAQFIDDLYQTFYQRSDAGGVSYWLGQMASGMNREAVYLHFAFSAEFDSFMTARLGSVVQREDVSYVLDVYRGALGRLPDAAGFRYWLDQLRGAACWGDIWAVTYSFVVNSFAGTEALNRNRSNRQFVVDNYDTFFRSGPDATGLNYWTGEVDAQRLSRSSLTASFYGYIGDRVSRMGLTCYPPGSY